MCTGALRWYDCCAVWVNFFHFIKLLKNALIRVGVQVWSTLLSRRRLVRPQDVERKKQKEKNGGEKKNCVENKIIAGETT